MCSARNGAKVLLVERYGFLGGLVTAALVITTPPLNNGLNKEIAERLNRAGGYDPCGFPGELPQVQLHSVDPEILKYELIQILKEHEVRLLLHTYITGSIVEGSKIKGVIIENKAGRQAILAKVVVDATGDGDVLAGAKVPYETDGKPSPMTMMFNMVGVETEKAIAQIGHWSKLRNVVEEGIKKGEISFDLGFAREPGAPGVYAANLIYPGEINVWSGNFHGMSGLKPEDLTEAELITREHVIKLANFLKKTVAGFEKSRVEYTATQVGVRGTRRMVGKAMPSLDEVKSKIFVDTVAKPYRDKEMRVPYGSLVGKEIENLLVAGRCISVREDAMIPLRLIPGCLATGQAAGTAAAMAIKQGVKPAQLDVSLLQKGLIQQGVELG